MVKLILLILEPSFSTEATSRLALTVYRLLQTMLNNFIIHLERVFLFRHCSAYPFGKHRAAFLVSLNKKGAVRNFSR